MKRLLPALLLAAMGVLPVGAALGQSTETGVARRDGPASLRCSALEQISEAERPYAVYFLAGYSDGERDAMTVGGVGAEGAEIALPTAGGPPAAILPVIAVEAVLATCAQSPDSRIVDIIVAQGASG